MLHMLHCRDNEEINEWKNMTYTLHDIASTFPQSPTYVSLLNTCTVHVH